jgi:hypothetical protein
LHQRRPCGKRSRRARCDKQEYLAEDLRRRPLHEGLKPEEEEKEEDEEEEVIPI